MNEIKLEIIECMNCKNGWFPEEEIINFMKCPHCGIEYLKRNGYWFENNIENLIEDLSFIKIYLGDEKWKKIWEAKKASEVVEK